MCIVLSCILKRRRCFENWLFFRQLKRGKTSTPLVPVQSTDPNHWIGSIVVFLYFSLAAITK